MRRITIIRFVLACAFIAHTMAIATPSYAMPNTQINSQNPKIAFYSDTKQKWGFKDSYGNVVIKPKYHYAESFRMYRAIVKTRNKYGVINMLGDYVIPPKYELIEYASDLTYIATYAGKKGIITIVNSSTSKVIVPFKYDDISYDQSSDVFITLKDGHKGLLASKGKEIIPCIYDDIAIHSQYRFIAMSEGKCGMYTHDGTMIMKCIYDAIKESSGYYIVSNNEKQGVCTLNGHEIIECKYDDISISSEYMLAKLGDVCTIYENFSAKEINNFIFDTIYPIDNDFIFTFSGKYGLIAEDNYAECPTLYDSIKDHYMNVYIVKCNNKYGILSDSGRELIPTILNQLDLQRLNGWQLCEAHGKYYMVSHNEMLTLSDYERRYSYPWDVGYSNSVETHDVIFDNIISPLKFERIDGTYEENVGENTYTHYKGYKTVTLNGISINFIKHQIDKQYYIYIQKDNVIKRKITGADIINFAKIEDAHSFKLKSAQLLSNGDILLETENTIVVGHNDIYTGPPTYVNIQGQLMCVNDGYYREHITNTMKYIIVIDGTNFKLKHSVMLPEQSMIVGISNYDGWYVASDADMFFASSSYPISKFSNKCELVWSYTPNSGIKFATMCETPESIYLGGYTQNSGYIGRFNPYICRLDRETGVKGDDKFYKIANQEYSVVEFEDGKAKIAPIRERGYYSTDYYYYLDEVSRYDFSDIEPFRMEVKCCVYNDIYAYGLVNQYGEWVIKPVLPGEPPVKYGDWTVFPCNIYLNSYEELCVSKSAIIKYKGKDIDGFIYEREIEEEIFVTVAEMPTFQGGGLPEFRNWVQSNVKYPEIALENGIQGNVVVQFIVDTDGKMTNFKVLQSPDKTLSDATIEVFQKANNLKKGWKPGKQRGKAVKVKFELPVNFAIQGYGD